MQSLEMKQNSQGLHVEGVDDAVKIVLLEGKTARYLADLSLHRSDLEFAFNCLEKLSEISDADKFSVTGKSLWHSAIIHFIKCFGKGVRSFLDENNIYTNNLLALEAFNFFLNLRNKHIIHDVNSYAHALPGAAINDGSKEYKIEKIICVSVMGVTLDEDSYDNLCNLINDALRYVTSEFDEQCVILTKELEAESYQSLERRPVINVSIPPLSALKKARKKP